MNKKVGFLSSLRDMKWELSMNFVTMILGILIGFRLQQYHEQSLKDEGTNAKINLFLIELDENTFVANNYIMSYKTYSEQDTTRYFFKSEPLSNTASTILLEDENILTFLNIEEIAIIKGYIRLINLMNNECNNYINLLLYGKNELAPLSQQYLENISKNAVSVIAYKYILDQEFIQIIKQEPYNNDKLKNIYKRIEDFEKEIFLKNK